MSSGEGGSDVYTPGQSPKEQADQVSPHTLDQPQLHPKILSACKSGYCLHKCSFCLPSPSKKVQANLKLGKQDSHFLVKS